MKRKATKIGSILEGLELNRIDEAKQIAYTKDTLKDYLVAHGDNIYAKDFDLSDRQITKALKGEWRALKDIKVFNDDDGSSEYRHDIIIKSGRIFKIKEYYEQEVHLMCYDEHYVSPVFIRACTALKKDFLESFKPA